MGSIVGRIVLFGFVWALFYHLANGIRHLFWDAGFGFELKDARSSGLVVVAVSLVLTAVAFAIGCIRAGAIS
jgi:succinate dehydrogenase / fumarate reductase cytochrome b subunit